MSKYELWYSDDAGNRLAYINDVVAFDMVHVIGAIGGCNITIPSRGQIYDNATPDHRIAFYRQPLGGTLSLEFLGFMRDTDIVTSEAGQYQRTKVGYDANELLKRRIVANYAGTSYTSKTDFADDLQKLIVTENFVDNLDYSGTPALSRALSGVGFTVQSDASAGVSISKGFSWRNVLLALQDIQADTKEQGAEVFFGITPTSENSLQFETWLARSDRTVSTGTNPLVFSLEWGNLFNPRLSDSTSEEENYIYSTGQETGTNRIVQTAYSETRINTSIINRREGQAWSNGATPATVLTDAKAQLELSRPKRVFTGSIIDTPLTPYKGAGWKIGDTVTVNYNGEQWDVLIRAVHIQMTTNGDETISARVESIST